MCGNGIDERQNQELNIMKLAAMRQLYSDAKSLFIVKFLICTALVILGNLFSIFKAQNDLTRYIFLFIKIGSAIVPFLTFDKWINSKKELAAIIQEEFDSNVLNTNWNQKGLGAKGIHNQEINYFKNKYAKKFKNTSWQTQFINWYDIQYSQMKLNIGRIYCQASNIHWDKELRLNFKKITYIFLMTLLLLLFAVCSFVNNKFLDSLEYVFLPFAPLIIFMIQIIIANNKTVSELDHLRNQLNILIIEKDNPDTTDEKLSDLSNSLQERIYAYRKNAFLIPDTIYNINRNRQEKLNSDYASMEKQQYDN